MKGFPRQPIPHRMAHDPREADAQDRPEQALA